MMLSALLGVAMHAALIGADWSPDAFDYNRPARLDVREAKDPGRMRVAGAAHQHFVFRDLGGQEVPVLVTLPAKRVGPFPVVVLVHGYASTREQVTRHLAPELVRGGFATIAIDLPMHGDRPGPAKQMFVEGEPKKTFDHIVRAVVDLRQAIDFAEARKDLDTSKGVRMVGYSMGGWLAALAGAADRRVGSLVLMVPISEAAPLDARARAQNRRDQKPLLDRYPALRPTGAIARFGPRPVLIQAGNLDLYLPKDPVEGLYAAAGQPKELRWYDSGHILPEEAVEEAAKWLLQRGSGGASGSGGKPGTRGPRK